jgi:predicted transcriptional regulator
MATSTKQTDIERTRIILGLLESVERDGAQTQRHLASELGIALGLVNAYLKRCVNKGLVKVREAPTRRYAYYLTPRGFSEKSRLTLEYVSYSFSLFRQAKRDFTALFETARSRGVLDVVLVGASDLAEIAAICALDSGVAIAGVVDSSSTRARFVGAPVFSRFDEIPHINAVMLTDLGETRATIDKAVIRFGAERVLVPDLLLGRVREQ